jgi:Zn-dependent M16 (insulinase) family peptidase
MVQQSILSAFAELDRPLSPGSRGYREFVHQRQGLTHELLQAFRDGLLAVDREQLGRVARTYLDWGFAGSSVGVLAGDQMFAKAQPTLAGMRMEMQRLGNG